LLDRPVALNDGGEGCGGIGMDILVARADERSITQLAPAKSTSRSWMKSTPERETGRKTPIRRPERLSASIRPRATVDFPVLPSADVM
jgi:hypothetical protein